MLRRVTWRSWAILAAILGAYIALGWLWLGSDDVAEAWIYRVGLTGAALMPLVFVAVYTATRRQWWTNDVGSVLVQTALCLVPICGPLAWVFWFQHGQLTNTMLAWLAVSGPALATVALARLAFIFWRIAKDQGDG